MSDKDQKSKSTEAEELREILGAVQETIPQLIGSLVKSIYSPDMAKSIAESVGVLYSNLKKQGIPDELALEMTRNYMNILDIKDLISEGISKGAKSGDVEVEVERAVRRKLKEKEKD
ncbi:MAG: hypothetical protein ACFFDE_08460 [Promethearchaeota archaeon]